MDNCIFCKIVKKEIPSDIITETEDLLVFKDLHPTFPVHYLIATKKHYKDVFEIEDGGLDVVRRLALKIQKDEDLDGFRLAINAGSYPRVAHFHAHFHSKIPTEEQ